MDIESTDSSLSGVQGLFEKTLRRFKVLMHLLSLMPLYLVASFCFGVCLTPGIYLFKFVTQFSEVWSPVFRNLALGTSLALGYFSYGFTLIFLVPLINIVFRTKLTPWRGPYYSLNSVRWYIHNGLTYLVRYTFLEFITPTPFNILFYRMMGMKIGKGVQINSTCISDVSLIELGNKVTIGGSVTIIAHYGVSGFLIIAPVKIKDGATIGLRAVIMAGTEIGENAKVLPNSVVMPKTIIGAGETWGGVPAEKQVIKKAA